jgi:hypothetical protein
MKSYTTDVRFILVSASCVTIYNPGSLSGSETEIHLGEKELKHALDRMTSIVTYPSLVVFIF